MDINSQLYVELWIIQKTGVAADLNLNIFLLPTFLMVESSHYNYGDLLHLLPNAGRRNVGWTLGRPVLAS
jgi:hypothetical protein